MMFHQECSVFSSVAIAAVQAKKLLSVRSSAGIIARIFGYSLHTGYINSGATYRLKIHPCQPGFVHGWCDARRRNLPLEWTFACCREGTDGTVKAVGGAHGTLLPKS